MEKGTTERLSRLIDGDLDRAETEEVMSLLESNRALRRELDGLNRVRASLRSLADREHPPDPRAELLEHRGDRVGVALGGDLGVGVVLGP